MMRWSTIKPALITLFSNLAVDQPTDDAPTFEAQWRNQRTASTFVHTAYLQTLTIMVTTCVGIGEDERRYVTEGDQLIETIYGLRRFTVNLRSEVNESDDDESAMQTLERIRTRLKLRSSLDALLAVNVALVEVTPALDLSRLSDGRMLSGGNMDVILCAAVNDRDPNPVGWIEHIKLTTRVTNEAGTPLPSPPNLTDEVLPPEE